MNHVGLRVLLPFQGSGLRVSGKDVRLCGLDATGSRAGADDFFPSTA